jgi:hypothetical protein
MRQEIETFLRADWGVVHRIGRFSWSGLGPLSMRGVVVLLYVAYLLSWPASGKSDIISASISYGLLGVIALALLVVVLQGLLIRNRVTVTVISPSSGASAREVSRMAIILPPLRLLPLTCLDITLESPLPEFPKAALRVTGHEPHERRLALDLSLPHRGSWSVSGVRCEVRDAAGLCRLSWLQPLSTAIEIAPPVVEETRLPLISSTQRPGDMLTDTLNRQGDPFDIKAYHPSDGMKKIVWKAFAKRGELLSRHPEASMTPEGFVVMFVLARAADDVVCAQALAYSRAVTELKLDIVMGCEGCDGRPPAMSVDGCTTLLVDSVWGAEAHDGKTIRSDATALIDFCESQALKVRVRKMIIFCSGARIADPQQAKIILALATWLAGQGIDPIFCLTEPARLVGAQRQTLAQRILPLLRSEGDEPLAAVPAATYQRFLSDCLAKQWEVFV